MAVLIKRQILVVFVVIPKDFFGGTDWIGEI